MLNWKKYKLGDLVSVNELVIKKDTEWINYIDIKSVNTGTYEEPKRLRLKEAPSRARRLLRKGDTVISSVRPYLKSYFYTNEIDKNTVASTGFAVITPKKIDNRFLYYLTTNDNYIQFLTNSCVGSAYPAFNQDVIEKSEVFIPEDINVQHRIAEILGALDDKIELNLQMNKILEEMAMALYKHWFVDFGPFKDEKFVDSELGMIPEGWEVKAIGDVIETLGGGTPSTKVKEYWDSGNIDWYSPTDLTKSNSLFSIGTAKKITELGLRKSSARLFPPYSVLMSSRATIGAITINRKEACTNQGFITLIPNDTISIFQIIGWLNSNMRNILSKANGSTFKEISKSNFRNLTILKAKDINAYINKSKSIFGQIESNILEKHNLIQTRDYLLPKLISGEIEVKEAEKEIKEIL